MGKTSLVAYAEHAQRVPVNEVAGLGMYVYILGIPRLDEGIARRIREPQSSWLCLAMLDTTLSRGRLTGGAGIWR